MSMKLIKRFGYTAAGLVMSGAAMAATDTSGVTSAISDAGTAIGVVGSAILVMVVGTKVFKWIARAL